MKIKLFHGVKVEDLEKAVNDFLIDREVVDIVWKTDAVKTSYDKNEYTMVDSVLVMYK